MSIKQRSWRAAAFRSKPSTVYRRLPGGSKRIVNEVDGQKQPMLRAAIPNLIRLYLMAPVVKRDPERYRP